MRKLKTLDTEETMYCYTKQEMFIKHMLYIISLGVVFYLGYISKEL